MIPGSANPLLLASAAAGGYQGQRSLRFNSSDSAFCSRTPAVAGNRRTWTWAGWVKRSALGGTQRFFIGGSTGAGGGIQFSSDVIEFFDYPGSYAWDLITTQVFRDTSAWYHILASIDTTQATSSNRAKVYVNGTQVTAFSTSSYPTLNYDGYVNSTVLHTLSSINGTGEFFSGYLADIHFIDGQALTPSSFTEVSATTGQLIPKTYSGTYGTNGFQLKFADNSAATAATLGKDTSGNSNNWTPNNLSVTAGAGNDSLVDTPTSYGTDTGVGGEVRGNYCIVNAVLPYTNVTLSNGNLDFVSGAAYRNAVGTIGVSFGKWYWEVLVNTWSSDAGIGITNNPANVIVGYLGSNSSGWAYSPYPIGGNGSKYGNGAAVAYGATYTSGDIIGVVLDADNGTLTFYKNGVSQGTAFTGLAANTYFPAFGGGSATSMVVNFGQRAFAYTAPSGFKALCDTNLPTPVVAKPNTLMDVLTWTGTGTGADRTISGLNFTNAPGFIWGKSRSNAYHHTLWDVVRGYGQTNVLSSDRTEGQGWTASGRIKSAAASSITWEADSGSFWYDGASTTYAAWCWDAGTTTASNGSGSITSQVRANASAGFSVVTWNGNGNATIGHGLGVAPQFIICKKRTGTSDWQVGHNSLGWTKRLGLNLTTAEETTISAWNNTSPTSTVFSIGNTSNFGGDIVAYCFAPVVGYSSAFTYNANGSNDGPMVYLGFRPRFILLKSTNISGTEWMMWDAARGDYNVVNPYLLANRSNAEGSTGAIDFLSNGFKLRNISDSWNNSGATGTYVGFAWAESPFQYARAR